MQEAEQVMTRNIVGLVLGIVMVMAAANLLAKESAEKRDPSTIRVAGKSTVGAKPDQLELVLGA